MYTTRVRLRIPATGVIAVAACARGAFVEQRYLLIGNVLHQRIIVIDRAADFSDSFFE
jgi:hypothetical protein